MTDNEDIQIRTTDEVRSKIDQKQPDLYYCDAMMVFRLIVSQLKF